MHASRASQYTELFQAIKERIASERDPIANAANVSALIFEYLNSKIHPIDNASNVSSRVNWCGFYFVKPSSGRAVHHGSAPDKVKSGASTSESSFSACQLVLGPFQGMSSADYPNRIDHSQKNKPEIHE
jgi:putative methionine-R-sulfoxide reductase with GAF domain